MYTHFYQYNKHIMYILHNLHYTFILTCTHAYITYLHNVYTQKHIYMMSQVNDDILTVETLKK